MKSVTLVFVVEMLELGRTDFVILKRLNLRVIL